MAVELGPVTPLGSRLVPASTFDCSSVGLILRPMQGRLHFDSTPLNADTFAETGGDGVHYSLLQLSDRTPEDSPVVMTAPMAMEHSCNIVVGSNFIDFLSLGCRYGYFAIEQLAYDHDQTVNRIQSGVHAFPNGANQDALLASIRNRVGLQPWPDVRSRLADLHSRLFPLIRLPPRNNADAD